MNSEVIATREYLIIEDGGSKLPLVVNIFKPKLDEGDWRCHVEIHERGNSWPHSVVGIDSLQAIDIAIQSVKKEIISLQKYYKGAIEFLGQKDDLWI